MVMPNGGTRIVQYNKNTKRAFWNFRGKQIRGEMFEQLGITYFLPLTDEHRLLCYSLKFERVRYPVPKTEEEWRRNQREIQSRAYQKKKLKRA
jgi:hypothetical protein